MNDLAQVSAANPDTALDVPPIMIPEKFVAAVFDPFKRKLATAKRAAGKVESYDVTTTAGMSQAKELRASFRDIRTSVENERKARKAPIIAAGKLLDARAAELTAEIEPLETKYDAEIKAEEGRRLAEKQRKEAEERARVEAIEGRIAQIRNVPGTMAAADSLAIRKEVDQWTMLRLDPDDYQEYLEDALRAVNTTLEQLGGLLAAAEAREAEQRRIAEEREELAKLRAEQEARAKAERAATAERERLAQIERDKAEAERRAAAEREADAARKLEAAQAQQARQQQLMQSVMGIQNRSHFDGSVRDLIDAIEGAERLDVSAAQYGDLAGMAQMAKTMAIASLRQKCAARLDAELPAAWDEAIAEDRAQATPLAFNSDAEEDDNQSANSIKPDHAFERPDGTGEYTFFAVPAGNYRAQSGVDGRPELVPTGGTEKIMRRPSDEEMVEVLATHYGVSEDTVIAWLKSYYL